LGEIGYVLINRTKGADFLLVSDGAASARLAASIALVAARLALSAAHLIIRSRLVLVLAWRAIGALQLLRIAVAPTLVAVPHLQIELRDVSTSVALAYRRRGSVTPGSVGWGVACGLAVSQTPSIRVRIEARALVENEEAVGAPR
jgi:hypothetical protein